MVESFDKRHNCNIQKRCHGRFRCGEDRCRAVSPKTGFPVDMDYIRRRRMDENGVFKYAHLIKKKEKNMSKLTKAAVLFLLICSLTGCFPTGEPNEPSSSVINSNVTVSSDKNDSDLSSSTPKEIENLKIDVPLPDSYPTELPTIKATRRDFDAEAVKLLFIDGKTIAEDHSGNGRVTLDTTDGATLSISKGDVTFIPDSHLFDGEDEKRAKSLMQQTAAEHVISRAFEFPHAGNELEGFSRSEALERADELVKKLNIKYLGEPQIYAVTAEDSHNFDEEIVLNKEDECYLVKYLTIYDDISINETGSEIFPDVFNQSSYVDVILTKDKLVKFQCHNIFDAVEETGTTQVKCSAENALSKLFDYYDMQVELKNRYEYDKMGFVYITSDSDFETGEFIYSPLLRVSGRCFYEQEPETGYTYYRYIDPVTGTVLNSDD